MPPFPDTAPGFVTLSRRLLFLKKSGIQLVGFTGIFYSSHHIVGPQTPLYLACGGGGGGGGGVFDGVNAGIGRPGREAVVEVY